MPERVRSVRGRLAATVLGALAAWAVGSVGVRACDSCSSASGVLTTPTYGCQSFASATDGTCGNLVVQVQLNAGQTYEFSLCGATCPTGSAAFSAVERLYDPSCTLVAEDDSSCGVGAPLLTYAPATSGAYALEIAGATATDFGAFTMVYRQLCTPSSCAAPLATLPAASLAWQTVGGTVECGDSASYGIALAAGDTTTFTLCSSTQAAAYADFDSILTLTDPSGIPAGSDGSACGDDGEVRVVATAATAGTWCVTVAREAPGGTDDTFTLAYAVTCRAPTSVTVGPSAGTAGSTDCARDVTFSVATDGTPDLTLDWDITPPAGGSATPVSGSRTVSSSPGSFVSHLVGRGTYHVHVVATNTCGTSEGAVDFDLRDRSAPDLTVTADDVPCGLRMRGAAPIAGPVRHPGGALPPPSARSLSCPSPSTSGTLTASGLYYDVLASAATGAFSARTGAQNAVTLASGPQNVIFGGVGATVGTSSIAWFFHDFGTTMQAPPGGAACLFDPPDTPAEPASTGIEIEWSVQPAPGYDVTLREEVVAFGTADNNAGIRLSLGARSAPTSPGPLTVGVRWEIDFQNGGDDGPLFATLACSPPTVGLQLSTEHDLLPSEILDLFRMTNNTGSPIFSNYVSTNSFVGFPGTDTPDRLVYGQWGSLAGSTWNYAAREGSPGPDADSAVLYYRGFQPGGAATIAPGEGFMDSMILFASNSDLDCSGFTPGIGTNASATVCEGQCVRLGASATDGCGTATVTLASTSAGAPPCSGNPCNVLFPVAGTYQYTWSATDDAGNATEAVAAVEVRPASACSGCSPVFSGAQWQDPDRCAAGIQLDWPAATFPGPTGLGVYNVFRSTSSCVDAATLTPLVTGLTGTTWTDPAPPPDVDLYYLVEAEDAVTPSTCLPLGADHGGAATQVCVGPARDLTAGHPRPAGVLAALRASHDVEQVTMDWTRARALLPGEHFHLRKASGDPRGPYPRVNAEGDTSLTFVETDTSSPVQFFDLFVADTCEAESDRDYPPGLP